MRMDEECVGNNSIDVGYGGEERKSKEEVDGQCKCGLEGEGAIRRE